MSTLYDIITVLPFSVLAVILFGGYAGIPEESSIWGGLICLAAALFIILVRNMKRKNRLRIIGIISVFIIGLILAAGEDNRQFFLKEYLWVLWTICISAAVTAAGFFMNRNIWVRRAAAVALLIWCIIVTILGNEISKEAFALICLILIVRIAEEIQRYWKKSGCPDIKEHITRISPLFLALCLIVYAVPAPDEPYDWQIAKDIYNGAASLINRIYGYLAHPTDDYGKIGFSDNGSFLSGLGENDEDVLLIEVGNTAVRNVRLVGCISGDFTGREWVFSSGTESVSRMIDTLETCCAVRKFDTAFQSDHLQKTDMYYKTFLYNTRYIFSPAKIRMGATSEKTAGISEKNGSIVSEQRFGYNDNYLISSYVLNYSDPRLPELFGGAEPIDETEWYQAAKAEDVLDKDGYTYEDYLGYRKDVYENYCHSFDVSEDVGAILDKIKTGSSGRYDTAKKLETYLKGMEYSTDCGALPDSVSDAGSFLDWFLLTSRKGWCMHYATAFTLMANEMGIPCRYVQGYIAKRDISGDMVVKQSNAHAWPEVYFDNAGWVAFEPTPGYSVPVGWGTRGGEPYDPDKDKADEEPDDIEDEKADAAEETVTTELDPVIFIIPSAAVICFLLVFYIISRSLSRRKYERMSRIDRFRYLTHQELRFLAFLGFPMEQGETLSELSERIISSDRQDLKDKLGFIPIYETVLYSDRELTEEDISSAEAVYRDLREIVKKSRLRFRLLFLFKKQ